MGYRSTWGVKLGLGVTLLIAATMYLLHQIQRYIPAEMGVITTIFTFIYGFYTSSLFSMVRGKYHKFKSAMADVGGHIETLHHIVRIMHPDIRDAVDKELIAFLDELVNTDPEQYEDTQTHVNNLYNALHIDDKPSSAAYNQAIDEIAGISKRREHLELYGDKYLRGENRALLIFSTALLSLLILLVTTPLHIWLSAIGGIVVLVNTFVISLIFDLDDVEYGKHSIRRKNLAQLQGVIHAAQNKR